MDNETTITTLTSVYKPESVTLRKLAFPDAVLLFCHHVQAINKESVKCYSHAGYGKTQYKADENVEHLYAGIVDFDNSKTEIDPATGKPAKDKNGKLIKHPSDCPTLPEDQHDNLSGLTYFWHSTFSNTAEWPKWRLIIPLERPATLQEWPFVVNGIVQLLGGPDPNIDVSCFELSRAFYIPSYPKEHAGAAFSGYSDGKGVFNVR